MGERYLHKSNKDTGLDKASFHDCGEPIPPNQKMLTNEQAMALKTCPKCFAENEVTHLISQNGASKKIGSKGWL